MMSFADTEGRLTRLAACSGRNCTGRGSPDATPEGAPCVFGLDCGPGPAPGFSTWARVTTGAGRDAAVVAGPPSLATTAGWRRLLATSVASAAECRLWPSYIRRGMSSAAMAGQCRTLPVSRCTKGEPEVG